MCSIERAINKPFAFESHSAPVNKRSASLHIGRLPPYDEARLA